MAQKTRRSTIKLALLDEHPVVRSGIVASLSAHPAFRIVSESETVADLVRSARRESPDIVLLGVRPEAAAAREILQQLPEVKIIVVASFESSEEVRGAVSAGVRGYLLTTSTVEEIIAAIEAVHSGDVYFTTRVSRAFAPDFVRTESGVSKLTPREREVLILVARGHTSKEIARILAISVRTVDSHREHIMRKLGVHSIAGLTRLAIADGLIDPP